MSTGAVLNHGVSGYACTGYPGEFQEGHNGTPWELPRNDTILSYSNTQNHIGAMWSNFNEPWSAGNLADPNMSAQPYRAPVFGPVDTPPPPKMPKLKVASIDYPDHRNDRLAQQLPLARYHMDTSVQAMDRQNLGFEMGAHPGFISPIIPQGNIFTTPNAAFFQGSNTQTGVHPNNDVANQVTAGNTARADFTGGQAPFAKLPAGFSVGQMQPGEPPAMMGLAPPPDPQVLPGEGTAPLHTTNPAWW